MIVVYHFYVTLQWHEGKKDLSNPIPSKVLSQMLHPDAPRPRGVNTHSLIPLIQS